MKNKKYTENKKNSGVVPAVLDDRTRWVPIGCQECIECRKKKAREWQVRLAEDIKEHKNGKFITLTFSDEAIKKLSEGIEAEGYKLDNEIAIKATRLFLERWRKKYKKSIRHWLVTELGHNGTENIHMHGIVWTNESMDEVEKIWQYGWIWKGRKTNGVITNYVNGQTVNYIIKYVMKGDDKHVKYKSRILTSAGIGNRYTKEKIGDWQRNEYSDGKTNETYKDSIGNKISLPIYYRNKIYTDEEREKLWIEKLDREERWVMGCKIDVSVSNKEYDRAIEEAREINMRLGYGTGEKDYEREQYERNRRIIMQKTRIEKANKKASGGS